VSVKAKVTVLAVVAEIEPFATEIEPARRCEEHARTRTGTACPHNSHPAFVPQWEVEVEGFVRYITGEVVVWLPNSDLTEKWVYREKHYNDPNEMLNAGSWTTLADYIPAEETSHLWRHRHYLEKVEPLYQYFQGEIDWNRNRNRQRTNP
jgi:hypothetical protein